MATLGPFSSSPVRMAPHDAVLVISSSPEFPSICDLLPKAAKKPPLRSGSNAAPVPDDAPSTFTSAASMWRLSREGQAEDAESLDLGSLRAATSTETVAVTTTEDVSAPCPAPANPDLEERRKPKAAITAKNRQGLQTKSRERTNEPTTEPAVPEIPVPKKGRKPRASKDTTSAQTTLPKGKVTKAAAKETKSKKKTETVSRHFAPQVSAAAPAAPEVLADPIEDDLVILEPAMRRRLDWTPPRETAPAHDLAVSSTMMENPSSAGSVRDDVFKTLQDTYGRDVDAVPRVQENAASTTTTDVLGKRKLIEMVAHAGNRQKTPEISPTKPKAAKKKPRTITALATAAYRQPEEASTDTPQNSLLGYLEPPSEPTTAGCKGAASKAKTIKRPSRAKPRPTKKKEESSNQLLLSPTSAMRQVARQDFVFGTASQLATEDDPELLRALHEAMKMSNEADGDPFASPSPANSSLAIRRKPGAGLWAAGARYDGGDLLDLEVLDLTRSSPIAATHLQREAAPASQQTTIRKQTSEKAVPTSQQGTIQDRASEEICIDIDMSDDTLDFSNSPPVGHPTQLPLFQPVRLGDSNSSRFDRPQTPVLEADFDPPPSNQEQHQLLLSQSRSPRQKRPEVPPQPNFELYTDARLAKEVASYGFKVVKKRTAMIALLNQCWASQNRTGLGCSTAQASMSTTSTVQAASPTRPKGRPRKNSAAPSADVAAPKRGRKKSPSLCEIEGEPPQPEKRPRGRPRKDSQTSASDTAEVLVSLSGGRKKGAGGSIESSAIGKLPRGRPKKDAPPTPVKRPKANIASPKRAKSLAKVAATVPTTTPRRGRALAGSVIEIPDSESDDPFASTPPSSPDHGELFSSPPAMDLSVTEDTEASLVASPTSQQVALFRYITQAVISAPRTTDPANPSWHDKMLMYDPIILEDLTAWLNAGQLDRVGHDGEVAPGDVKKWCESKSVCCLWRENLRGKERKRF